MQSVRLHLPKLNVVLQNVAVYALCCISCVTLPLVHFCRSLLKGTFHLAQLAASGASSDFLYAVVRLTPTAETGAFRLIKSLADMGTLSTDPNCRNEGLLDRHDGRNGGLIAQRLLRPAIRRFKDVLSGGLSSSPCVILETCVGSKVAHMRASRLSAVAHYSLFPLFFQPREYPIKVLLLALYCLAIWACLQDHVTGASNGFMILERLEEAQTGGSQASTSPEKSKGGAKEAAVASSRSEDGRKGLLSWLERWYLLGLVLVEVYASWLHAVLLGSRLPFLPLMLVSTYCAVGIGYAWLQQLQMVLRTSTHGKRRLD